VLFRSAGSKGNVVKAALLAARASGALDQERKKQAETALSEALSRMSDRIHAALSESEDESPEPWATLLRPLALRAATETNWLRYGLEARVLYTIQRAFVSFEREHQSVDVATWILSRGKRSVVRSLEATRELQVARSMQSALALAHHARLPTADRKALADALTWAARRSEAQARQALRPRLEKVFEKAGLHPGCAPERLAGHKLVEELLDQILARGYLTFPQLRDAISRNQLKLEDLSGGKELVRGDPLLVADAQLAVDLDGIYQRGDIYLRALQKASSLPFGTRIGRILTLYLILPLGGSFVILEGATLIFSPLGQAVGLPAFNALSLASFAITSAVIFGLLHSEPLRAFAKQALEAVGVALAWLFFRIPRAILSRPAVRRWLARPVVRLVIRRIIVPILVALAMFYITPLRHEDLFLGLAGALASFALVSGLAGTRIGRLTEDYVVEQLVPSWQVLSRQWLPGLLRLISGFFVRAMDMLQRGIYRIDEIVRFSRGNNPVVVVLKASVGLVWAMVSYLVRVYVTLLIEPEVNPLKHFPVCTVSHKLLLPFTPQMIAVVSIPLSPLGPIVGGAIAGVTVFLLPSAAGFLAWELKENYKLYRATLPDRLGASRIGVHGETMRGLLVAGLHSGTLPKLYERLRRTALREHEQMASQVARAADGKRREGSGIGKFREGIDEIERAVQRFVDRELLAYLQASPRWRFGPLSIADVEVSSNRIRIQIFCEQLSPLAAEITIEQNAGTIVAGMPSPGFVGMLQRESKSCTLLFENALAGFYHRAEVDLVREQIEAELGEGTHYEVNDEGLTAWPSHDYRTEIVYRLDVRRPKALQPKVKGRTPSRPPRALDTRRILYRQQTISWLAWVSAWVASEDPSADIPRLLSGTTILPGDHAALTPAPPAVEALSWKPPAADMTETTDRGRSRPQRSEEPKEVTQQPREPAPGNRGFDIMATRIGPHAAVDQKQVPAKHEEPGDGGMPVGAEPPPPDKEEGSQALLEAAERPPDTRPSPPAPEAGGSGRA